MCGAGLQPGTYFTRSFIFLGFFLYIRNIYFQEHLRVFAILFLLHCVKQEFTLFSFLFLQKIRRSVLVSYKQVKVNNKFTIIEFAPFSLVTKGAFVTFGKICNVSRAIVFIFSLIPCCPLSFKTERTIPLIFAFVVATYFAD